MSRTRHPSCRFGNATSHNSSAKQELLSAESSVARQENSHSHTMINPRVEATLALHSRHPEEVCQKQRNYIGTCNTTVQRGFHCHKGGYFVKVMGLRCLLKRKLLAIALHCKMDSSQQHAMARNIHSIVNTSTLGEKRGISNLPRNPHTAIPPKHRHCS